MVLREGTHQSVCENSARSVAAILRVVVYRRPGGRWVAYITPILGARYNVVAFLTSCVAVKPARVLFFVIHSISHNNLIPPGLCIQSTHPRTHVLIVRGLVLADSQANNQLCTDLAEYSSKPNKPLRKRSIPLHLIVSCRLTRADGEFCIFEPELRSAPFHSNPPQSNRNGRAGVEGDCWSKKHT